MRAPTAGIGRFVGPDRLRQMAQIAVREWVMSRTFKEVYEQRAALASDIQSSKKSRKEATKRLPFEIRTL